MGTKLTLKEIDEQINKTTNKDLLKSLKEKKEILTDNKEVKK